MSNQIKLEDCPEVLRVAVDAETAKWRDYNQDARIISCTVLQPSNGAETTHKAYIMTGNTIVILTYMAPLSVHLEPRVIKDMVTIGEIKEIMRDSPEWFD